MPQFRPNSGIVDAVKPSPNHGERRGARINSIVLHYTGMPSTEEALARLCNAGPNLEERVSAHYLVGEDGSVIQCVAEERRAWHAGASSWQGKPDVNSRSIGIEIANPGHDFGYPDFPAAQINAVIALCRDILERHQIRRDLILAHSDVAPTRKRDPGEKFPWPRLFDKGVGLWVEPELPDGQGGLDVGDRGEPVAALQAALMSYGYGIHLTGAYDSLTRDVVRAFQRHFRPTLTDGRADHSTIATLKRLLAARR